LDSAAVGLESAAVGLDSAAAAILWVSNLPSRNVQKLRLIRSWKFPLGSKFRRNSFQSRASNLAGTGTPTETSI
jgi:hypothetical protein